MRISITILILLTFCNCYSQTENEKTEKATKEALKEWFENPSLNTDTVDPKTFIQFKDSGLIENNLKEGYWVEYSVDTNLLGHTVPVNAGNKKLQMTLGGTSKKFTGTYVKGKKEGLWKEYHCSNCTEIDWVLFVETHYKNNQKNGTETMYQFQNPIAIFNWKDNLEHGEIKIFDSNNPSQLIEISRADMGVITPVKKYHTNGNLKLNYFDSVINNTTVLYSEEFDENTVLIQTGSFLKFEPHGTFTRYYKDSVIEETTTYEYGRKSGSYKYYYPNGNLWTERIYLNDNLVEVVSNYDSTGNKRDGGTLKDGNGTLKHYNDDGTLKKVLNYKNGELIKE